jgi:DNA-binding NarL/FixJ family response regulator
MIMNSHRRVLTERQHEIIAAIAEGMTNGQIAAHLNIAEFTVKHHVTRIFDKTGMGSRVELVIFAMRHGLIPVPEVINPPGRQPRS